MNEKAKLECKYKVREARNHFGVDPLTLPFVNDNGNIYFSQDHFKI